MLLDEHGVEGLPTIQPIDGGEIGGAAGGELDGWINDVLPLENGALITKGAQLAQWTNHV
jgi:hypothetical protein